VHHPAMPADDVPAFMVELYEAGSSAARALAFTILTAARTSETRGATWKEIEGDTWVIPAARMKEGREHKVPLAPQALALIGERGKPDAYLFPGQSRGTKLSPTTQMVLLRRTRPGFTVHGFRSTFADWCGDQGYPRELVEMALAHKVGDATEQAYRRGTLVNRRREMMEEWAAFACGIQALLE
jgi:integrase